MKIIDGKGRLFGKLSILDLGAACVILLVIFGIFVFPGTSGSVAQVGKVKPVEVDVVVRGLSVKNPEIFIEEFTKAKKTNIVIRNQPSGEVEIQTVKRIQRSVVVPQPDGSVKALPDPRPQDELLNMNLFVTLGGKAEINKLGEAALGGEKVKIGTTIELEGLKYNFNSSVIDVRILN